MSTVALPCPSSENERGTDLSLDQLSHILSFSLVSISLKYYVNNTLLFHFVRRPFRPSSLGPFS